MNADNIKSTREVAILFGIDPKLLQAHVWRGVIPEPARGPGRCFLWMDADIDRAARALGVSRPKVPA